MKYKEKYQKIIDELISKSFHSLKKKIKAFEFKITKLYGIYIPLFDYVGVNKLCRKFSDKEIRGILAHELCHAELSRKYGILKNFFLYSMYWIIPSIRKDEEIKTDKLTIKKGYAKELILSSKRLEEKYPNYKDKTFISPEQIKSYAKKIGKW